MARLKPQLIKLGIGVPATPLSADIPNVSEISRLIDADPSTFGFIGGAPRPARIILWRLAEEIGLTEHQVYQNAVVGHRLGVASLEKDAKMETLLAWTDEVCRRRLAVPEHRKEPGKPNFQLIAFSTGIPPGLLAYRKQPFRHVIERFAQEQGFISSHTYGEAMAIDGRDPRAQRSEQERKDRLIEYLREHHVKPNAPLPESTRAHGRPAYEKICRLAGLSRTGADRQQITKQAIDDVALIVGVGLDAFRPEQLNREISYREFLDHGSRRFLIEEGPRSTGLPRFQWAFRTWLKGVSTSEEDTFNSTTSEFPDRIAQTVANCAATMENLNTRRSWKSAIARWRSYASDLVFLPIDELPASFGGALRALVRKASYPSLRHLLRAANLEHRYMTIYDWLQVGREPLFTEREVLADLERFFRVPDGTLYNRIRHYFRPTLGHLRISSWPECLNTDLLRQMAKPLLPGNFADLDTSERERIGQIILKEIHGSIEYRRRMREATAWRLRPLPARLQSEIDDLIAYKTCTTAPFPRVSKWRPSTVDRNLGCLKTFFSAMALPRSDGGLGIKAEDLSIAYVATPSVFLWWISWLEGRYPEGLNTGARAALGLISHLVTPNMSNRFRRKTGKKGYLHHIPEMAARLKPIPDYLTQEEIDELQTAAGWETSLKNVHSRVWEFFSEQIDYFRQDRNPFEPIMEILKSPRPMDALYYLLDCVFHDLPDPVMATPRTRAIAVRRYVAVLLEVRTGLRRGNIGKLTYRRHNLGKLKRDTDHWVIEIPVVEFKNYDGPFFEKSKEPYLCHLPARDTAIIDEYINVSRPQLLAENTCDALLINRYGRSLAEDALHTELSMMTWNYLVYHETSGRGIPGVERFGPHAIRDIIVTHILKNANGDLNLAADAIQDSPVTVRKHYARFLPSDRTSRVNDFYEQDRLRCAHA